MLALPVLDGALERGVVGGVLAFAALYAVRAAWSEWRGGAAAAARRAPDWWPFRMPLWRALVRSGPIGATEAPLLAASRPGPGARPPWTPWKSSSPRSSAPCSSSRSPSASTTVRRSSCRPGSGGSPARSRSGGRRRHPRSPRATPVAPTDDGGRPLHKAGRRRLTSATGAAPPAAAEAVAGRDRPCHLDARPSRAWRGVAAAGDAAVARRCLSPVTIASQPEARASATRYSSSGSRV